MDHVVVLDVDVYRFQSSLRGLVTGTNLIVVDVQVKTFGLLKINRPGDILSFNGYDKSLCHVSKDLLFLFKTWKRLVLYNTLIVVGRLGVKGVNMLYVVTLDELSLQHF